jgi:hypothetical protein
MTSVVKKLLDPLLKRIHRHQDRLVIDHLIRLLCKGSVDSRRQAVTNRVTHDSKTVTKRFHAGHTALLSLKWLTISEAETQ